MSSNRSGQDHTLYVGLNDVEPDKDVIKQNFMHSLNNRAEAETYLNQYIENNPNENLNRKWLLRPSAYPPCFTISLIVKENDNYKIYHNRIGVLNGEWTLGGPLNSIDFNLTPSDKDKTRTDTIGLLNIMKKNGFDLENTKNLLILPDQTQNINLNIKSDFNYVNILCNEVTQRSSTRPQSHPQPVSRNVSHGSSDPMHQALVKQYQAIGAKLSQSRNADDAQSKANDILAKLQELWCTGNISMLETDESKRRSYQTDSIIKLASKLGIDESVIADKKQPYRQANDKAREAIKTDLLTGSKNVEKIIGDYFSELTALGKQSTLGNAQPAPDNRLFKK